MSQKNIDFTVFPSRGLGDTFITVEYTQYNEALGIVDKKLANFEHLGNKGRVIDTVVVRTSQDSRITNAVSYTAKSSGKGVTKKVTK